jgi:hypothetical protein
LSKFAEPGWVAEAGKTQPALIAGHISFLNFQPAILKLPEQLSAGALIGQASRVLSKADRALKRPVE